MSECGRWRERKLFYAIFISPIMNVLVLVVVVVVVGGRTQKKYNLSSNETR
jgi:cytochrome c oxidase subunit IV